MQRTLRILVPAMLACGVAVSGLSSCKPRVKEQCYEEVDYVEPEPGTLASNIPYCGQVLGIGPEPPDGYGFTHRVGVRFKPTEDEPCDPCDLERFEEMLRTAIEERVSQGSPSCARMDPSDPVGLCVHQPDETTDECRVLGIFYSNYHDVPVEHGCGDCRDNGTCDHNP